MRSRSETTTRSHSTSRKDLHVQHIDHRLADIAERQGRLRAHREEDRASSRATRSLRRRLGETLVRLGRRVGGETMTTPAWQG
jgi:hypothetical protein